MLRQTGTLRIDNPRHSRLPVCATNYGHCSLIVRKMSANRLRLRAGGQQDPLLMLRQRTLQRFPVPAGEDRDLFRKWKNLARWGV